MDENRYKKIIKAIDQTKVVSFDIFDTLLLRPFVHPQDVFKYMETNYGTSGFAGKRIKAENMARKNKKYEDITYEDIYQYLSEYDAKQELDTEQKILFANIDIKPVYEYAIKNAKYVVITSDMYLPKSFIDQVLHKNGYDGYKCLYVSSDRKKTKETGNLYKDLLEELDILPENLIHIGDNNTSDFTVPRKIGINAFHYSKISDVYLNRKKYRSKMLDTWIGSLFVQMSAVSSEMKNQTYWEKFGYQIAGPVCFSYVSWICKQIRNSKENLTDIAFIARDGYLLEKVFNRICGQEGVCAHYVFAPRMINIICELSLNSDISYFEKKHYQALLKYYKDSLPNVNVEGDIEELHKFVIENEVKIKQLAAREFEEYKRYISSEKFGKGKMYIVDSRTENFSAQNLIEKATNKRVAGLYWVVGNQQEEFENFAYQKEKQNVLLSWQLIEFIMSAPTPSIMTIKDKKPIYNDVNLYEDTRKDIFLNIEKGVERFIDNICSLGMENIIVPEPVIRQYLNDFCCNGDKRDISEFSSVMFSNNPDHSDLMSLMPFIRKAHNFSEFKENLFRKLTLHPRLYGMVRSLYHFLKKY